MLPARAAGRVLPSGVASRVAKAVGRDPHRCLGAEVAGVLGGNCPLVSRRCTSRRVDEPVRSRPSLWPLVMSDRHRRGCVGRMLPARYRGLGFSDGSSWLADRRLHGQTSRNNMLIRGQPAQGLTAGGVCTTDLRSARPGGPVGLSMRWPGGASRSGPWRLRRLGASVT
jgi:hypothetical protein